MRPEVTMPIALLGVLLACTEPAPPPTDLVVAGTLAPGDRAVIVRIRDGVIASVDEGPPPEGAITGDLVTAGFVDAHAHPAGLGRALASLDLRGLTTRASTVQAVAGASGDGWITGRGWDQNDWTDATGWPTAADLDAVAPERPVALTRVDGHVLWLNTAAMKAAGITAATADPEAGRLVRDASGAPSGVLVDAAMDLVDVPAPPAEEQERRLVAALDAIASTGLTGVHAMGVDDETLATYERLDAEGRLKVRIWAYLTPEATATERLLADGPWRGRHLAVVGVKAFADGALGSRGALLREPYADEPAHRGLALTSADDLAALATRAEKVHAQLAIHAIGDEGVRHALDAFEAARGADIEEGHVRFRVEHAQVVHPDDVPRFRALNVVASMQPTHATSDMPWAEARLGPERVRWAYAWRTVADAQTWMALGSDFPVEGVDPALGVWAATTRTAPDGTPEGGWLPEQKLTRDEAIAGFTSGAAWAVHEEERLGVVDVGRPADLTVWDVAADGRMRAIATIVDGEVVWAAADPASDAVAAP